MIQNEPKFRSFDGSSPIRTAKRLFLATRPMFFTASILPVLLGTAWGIRVGSELDGVAFSIALIATVLVHAAINVINDVCDDIGGTDRINTNRIYPFTGGSRFIQNEIMSREGMLIWGAILLMVACISGSVLAFIKGPEVIGFGVIGACLGIAYSVPPLQLSARGLGELAVGAGFGLLPVCGSAWLQSGIVNAETLLIALPISCWVFNILLINEIPDAKADGKSGKRTLVVRIGVPGTWRIYMAANILAFLAVGLAVLRELVPIAAITLPAVLMLVAIYLAWRPAQEKPHKRDLSTAIKTTLAIHTLGGIWLILFIWPW